MAAGNDGLIVDFDAAMAGPDVTMTGAIGGVSDTTQASKLAVRLCSSLHLCEYSNPNSR